MKQIKGKLLVRFAESFFLVGFTIVLLDLLWVIACGLRFGATYPNSMHALTYAALRDVAAIVFCYLFIGNHLRKPSRTTLAIFGINLVFLVLWFGLSPSPVYTDWTFAIRNGYNAATVATSFFISHIIGKTITGTFYISQWRKR